jgi:hypothetical protein
VPSDGLSRFAGLFDPLVYVPSDDSLTLFAHRQFPKRAVQQFIDRQLWTSTFGSRCSRIVLISESILTMRCAVAFVTKIWPAEVCMKRALLTVKIANA